jgi:hypothetical protein
MVEGLMHQSAAQRDDFYSSYTSSFGLQAAPQAPAARAPMPTLSIDVDFADIDNLAQLESEVQRAADRVRDEQPSDYPRESGVRIRCWCSED